MANFEDIGYEESFRITLTFDCDEYEMIEYICRKNNISKKDYFNKMIQDYILYMKYEAFK